MKYPKFYVGQVVRRKHSDGCAIGPYMRVEHIERDRVYASMIGRDIPNDMLLKKNVYVPTIFSLSVSDETIERLRKRKTYTVSHPATTRWNSIWKKKPVLVRFYSHGKAFARIFKIDCISKDIILREPVIKITVGQLVI